MALGIAKAAIMGAAANQSAPFDPYTYVSPTFLTTLDCTLSNGNRTAALSSSVDFSHAYSAGQTLSGRVYVEFKLNTSATFWHYGWTKFTGSGLSNDIWGIYNNQPGAPALVLSYGPPGVQSPGSIPQNTTFLDSNGNPIGVLVADDILSLAINVDSGTAWIGVNGEWYDDGGPRNDTLPLATEIVPGDVTGILPRFGNSNGVTGGGGTGTILTEGEAQFFNGGDLF
jgi:hypothetical protein